MNNWLIDFVESDTIKRIAQGTYMDNLKRILLHEEPITLDGKLQELVERAGLEEMPNAKVSREEIALVATKQLKIKMFKQKLEDKVQNLFRNGFPLDNVMSQIKSDILNQEHFNANQQKELLRFFTKHIPQAQKEAKSYNRDSRDPMERLDFINDNKSGFTSVITNSPSTAHKISPRTIEAKDEEESNFKPLINIKPGGPRNIEKKDTLAALKEIKSNMPKLHDYKNATEFFKGVAKRKAQQNIVFYNMFTKALNEDKTYEGLAEAHRTQLVYRDLINDVDKAKALLMGPGQTMFNIKCPYPDCGEDFGPIAKRNDAMKFQNDMVTVEHVAQHQGIKPEIDTSTNKYFLPEDDKAIALAQYDRDYGLVSRKTRESEVLDFLSSQPLGENFYMFSAQLPRIRINTQTLRKTLRQLASPAQMNIADELREDPEFFNTLIDVIRDRLQIPEDREEFIVFTDELLSIADHVLREAFEHHQGEGYEGVKWKNKRRTKQKRVKYDPYREPKTVPHKSPGGAYTTMTIDRDKDFNITNWKCDWCGYSHPETLKFKNQRQRESFFCPNCDMLTVAKRTWRCNNFIDYPNKSGIGQECGQINEEVFKEPIKRMEQSALYHQIGTKEYEVICDHCGAIEHFKINRGEYKMTPKGDLPGGLLKTPLPSEETEEGEETIEE